MIQRFTSRHFGLSLGIVLAATWASSATAVTPRGTFAATGQKLCYNVIGKQIACAGTGQDGDVRAGGPLRYVDNGDGTVTDVNTKLQWEKLSDDGSIHDKDDVFTWVTAFSGKIAELNADNFAGHNDWRLPNARELASIANFQNFNPATSEAFNKNCTPGATVLDGSCTATTGDLARYWSSTTCVSRTKFAWVTGFFDGGVGPYRKTSNAYVRAVRGGL